MHTLAYTLIQQKLGLMGREYMEGFSRSDFDGLTQDEQFEIIEILKIRAKKGDGISLDGLRKALPLDEFLIFTKSFLNLKFGADLFGAQLLTMLFPYAKNEDTWLRLVNILQQGDASARQWILNHLNIAELRDDWTKQLSLILLELIVRETDNGLLISEINTFLKTNRLVPRSEKFVQAARRLQSADIQERKRVLDDLGYET